MSVETEIEFRPEGEFRLEEEIPAETCEEGMGATRPTTDSASQYTTADKVTDKELTITIVMEQPSQENLHTFTLSLQP